MTSTASGGTAAPGFADVDPLRTALHAMWDSVAPAWARHAPAAEERGAPVTRAMLARADIREGDSVLELACGPGSVGIAAAEHVGATGRVVLSDVAPGMVAAAAERATGLARVTARQLDLEQIDEPDASFDVVLCREGLMLVPDPARALGEAHRVLRPGGRLAVAVWGPREENPWLGALFDAVTATTGAPVPPPGIPGPFSLDDADRVAELLGAAGFAEVSVEACAVPLKVASPEEWWTRVSELAGPLAQVLATLPPDVVAEIRSRAEETPAAFTVSGSCTIPGVSLIGSGRRP